MVRVSASTIPAVTVLTRSDVGMDGDEFLERSHLAKAKHGAVSSSEGQMGILRPVCPRHNLPTRRSRGDRSDGARHPCCHPPSSSASVMRVTAIHTQTERKRLDRFVRRAEKRCRRARALRLRGAVRPVTAVGSTADTARCRKACSTGKISRFWRQTASNLGNVGVRFVSARTKSHALCKSTI